MPGPRFRRGRDPLQTAGSGAGAWKAAPALYRGRGLKFLFCTPENENFSASKSLKNTKIASKFEPKVKKAPNLGKNWWFLQNTLIFFFKINIFISIKSNQHFQNFTGPGIWGQNRRGRGQAPAQLYYIYSVKIVQIKLHLVHKNPLAYQHCPTTEFIVTENLIE